MFEKSSRNKDRFILPGKGILMGEDLWDLSFENLNKIAVGLDTELADPKVKNFLKKATPEDAGTKRKFDIVLHVIKIKQEEVEKKVDAQERKEKRDKLLGLLDKKEDEKLANMTKEEIEEELKELQ